MDTDYSSDEECYTAATVYVPFIQPNIKDVKYGLERPQQALNKKPLSKPDASLSEWIELYTLWQGHNMPTALSRFDDLFIRFDTLYPSDVLLQWLKSTTNTPCIRKTQQNTFEALLRLCGIDDAECLKEYAHRLANIYYFNAKAWITDNRRRFRVDRSKNATGRKRNDDDLDLIQSFNLDPDLKITSPEWKSSLAQAYRKVIESIASPEEVQKRLTFFEEVAVLRVRAKNRRAKSKELTREKRDLIKCRKDALKPIKASKAMKASKPKKASKAKKASPRKKIIQEASEDEIGQEIDDLEEECESLDQASEECEASEEFEASEALDQEAAEEKEMARNTYIHEMESLWGAWSGSPREIRLSIEDQSTQTDTSMPRVEYFGMVLDFLICGHWTKEDIRSSFEWDHPGCEDVVHAIWTYCTFASHAMTDYLNTIERIRLDMNIQGFDAAESLNWIYECQKWNRRTLEELDVTCEFQNDENITPYLKSRIVHAISNFVSYF